jgi:tetratricopeptide (TPR) repeat protein
MMVRAMNQNNRTNEDSKLDQAIKSIAPSLSESLQRDYRQRRMNLMLGGILMASVSVIGIVALAFFLASPPVQAEDAGKLVVSGWKLLSKGQASEAAKTFSEATRKDPKSENTWNGLGWAKFHLAEYQASEEAFKRCVALSPKHPAALNGLGQLYLSQRQYAKAKEYFTQADQAGATGAWYGMIKVELLTGNFSEAEKWFKKLKSEPEAPETEMAHFEQAIRDKKVSESLRQMIEPPVINDAAKQTARGWQLFNEGNNRQAAEVFRTIIKSEPENESAINGLAFALLNSGEVEEAQPLFEKLLEKQPNHLGAKNGLARCLDNQGKTDEAIRLWKELESASPEVNAATYGLASALMKQEKFAEAIPYLRRLVEFLSKGGAGEGSDSQRKHYEKLLNQAKEKSRE